MCLPPILSPWYVLTIHTPAHQIEKQPPHEVHGLFQVTPPGVDNSDYCDMVDIPLHWLAHTTFTNDNR